MTDLPSAEWASEQINAALALARSGDVAAAEGIIQEVRRGVAIEAVPRVAVGSIFVEGVISAYRADWSGSRQRLLRVEALSRGTRHLHAEFLAASAWLAFVETNAGNLEAAGRYAATVLKEDQSLENHTACRAALVIATLFQHAGDAESASVWYSYARRRAEAACDSALISIVIFDSAVMRTHSARIERHLEKKASGDLRLEAMFAESSANYDHMSGVQVLAPLRALLRAQLLNLQCDHQGAMVAAEYLILNPGDLSGPDRLRARLEYWWAKARHAYENECLAAVDGIVADLNEFTDGDDLAIACAMISEILELAGEPEKSKAFAMRSKSHHEEYIAWQVGFRGFLASQFASAQ